jgi:hypothetical protein
MWKVVVKTHDEYAGHEYLFKVEGTAREFLQWVLGTYRAEKDCPPLHPRYVLMSPGFSPRQIRPCSIREVFVQEIQETAPQLVDTHPVEWQALEGHRSHEPWIRTKE